MLHGQCYKNRVENVLNTWGKNINHIFYADYEDKETKVIQVSKRTDYSSNEEKHVNVIKYLMSSNIYDFDWYFFCDDDTFVNVNNFFKFIEKCDTNCVYGSVLHGLWPQDTTLSYCSGGAGYLVHKTILKIISENIETYRASHSDVTFGLTCRGLNIPVQNSDFFHSQDPDFHSLPWSSICENITFHYIKSIEQINNFLPYLNKEL
jgi:hypothetical protein